MVESIEVAKKKSLFDLYQTERAFTLTDGETEIPIVLKKMNTMRQQTAQRAANAARAGIRALVGEYNEDKRQEFIDGLLDRYEEREDRITYLVEDSILARRQEIEAEVAGSDHWTKDDLLEGLEDAWKDGAKDKFLLDGEENEQARAVFDALREYRQEVDDKLIKERQRGRVQFEKLSDTELRELMLDIQIKASSDLAWMAEYQMQQIIQMTFSPKAPGEKSHEPIFSDRSDIDDLPDELVENLLGMIKEFSMTIIEGKDSGDTPAS